MPPDRHRQPAWPAVAALAVACFLGALAAPRAPSATATGTYWYLYAVEGALWLTDGDRPVRVSHRGTLAQPAVGAGRLAYVARDRNASDLWLATPDGHRALTRNTSPVVAENHWVAQPAIQPDGRAAYVLSDADKRSTGVGNLAIWQIDLDQGSLRQVTRPPEYAGGDQDVTLNPHDPRQIVFTRYYYDSRGEMVESLHWLDVRVGSAVPLTDPERPSRQAAFSPDGTELAFVQTEGGSENLFVARVDLSDGPRLSDVRLVATGVTAQPAWRPDGRELAYLALTGRAFQVWTVTREASGAVGAPRQVTREGGVDATSRPAWLTPDQAAEVRQWFQEGTGG